MPAGDTGLAIEPFGAVPNTYSVPFGAGLLVYVVPPQKQIVGLVVVYQPLAVWGWGVNSPGTLADGTVWAWGNNPLGQFGDGTTTSKESERNVSWASR